MLSTRALRRITIVMFPAPYPIPIGEYVNEGRLADSAIPWVEANPRARIVSVSPTMLMEARAVSIWTVMRSDRMIA